MPMIARHGLVAPAATVVSGSRARPARRVSAMKNSTGVHVPRRRSRAHLLCVVTGAPRPALASPRGSRVVRSAAAADALHADDPSEDRRDVMKANRTDGDKIAEDADPASRRVRYAYLALMVLASATAVAVSFFGPSPTLPEAIVPFMPRGIHCFDFTSVPGAFVRFVDYYGTAVFAQAGVVTAGMAGMNFLGCLVIGCITAMGGGSFRGFVLGEQVFWAQEPEYLYISLIASVAAFFLWPALERWCAGKGAGKVLDETMNWLDALAIAGFCVIGTNNGLRAAAGDPVVAIACGMFTASFGGIMRDALCAMPARILHSHQDAYASITSIGAAVFVTLSALNVDVWVRCFVPMAIVVLMRKFAWSNGLRLPIYRWHVR